MRKKLISLILCITMLFSLASCALGTPVCQHRDADDDGLCDYCGKPVEVEDTTEEDTTVEDTTEEVTTKKPAEVATEAPAATEEKKGCGATVSMSVLSLVALAGAGMVSFKKKEN